MARKKPMLQSNRTKSKLEKRTKKNKPKESRSSQELYTNDSCGSISTYRQLLRFKKIDEMIYLAGRLFQKEPQIYEGVENARELSISKSEEIGNIRQYILRTIEAIVCNNRLETNGAMNLQSTLLPTQWENYISFCDLVFASKHADSMNWATFVLQDYPNKLHAAPDTEDKENTPDPVAEEYSNRREDMKNWKYLPIHKVRKRYKKLLLASKSYGQGKEESDGHLLASVQADCIPLSDYKNDFNDTDINLNSACEEMLLIRILTTRKTRNSTKDRNILLTRRPTFFAYFPGEPYFYSSSAKPDPKFCQAMAECLYCTSYSPIPLADRDVFSLRRLRLNRDTLNNDSKVMKNLINDELINYYNEALLSRYIIDGQTNMSDESHGDIEQQNSASKPSKQQLPMLTKFEIRYTSKYRGDEIAFDGRKNCATSQQNKATNLTVNYKVSGHDVLNGFSFMARQSISSSTKYFKDPLPNWVRKSACRGRNFLQVNRSEKPTPLEIQNAETNESDVIQEMEDDAISIAASEMTNWGGHNKTRLMQ